jgi:hypothetical protein
MGAEAGEDAESDDVGGLFVTRAMAVLAAARIWGTF